MADAWGSTDAELLLHVAFSCVAFIATRSRFAALRSSVHTADALHAGLAQRRWLWETLIVTAAAFGALIRVALAIAAATSFTWTSVLRLALAACVLVTTVYEWAYARVCGEYADPASAAPRCAAVEFRRSRYKAYVRRLRIDMWPIRLAWVAMALTHMALQVWQLWCGASLLTVVCVQSDACEDAIRAAVAALRGGGHASPSLAYMALLLAYVAAVVVWCNLVLVLGGVSCVSVCVCVSEDYTGYARPAQAAWTWPSGTFGEHPSQQLPYRASADDNGEVPPSYVRRHLRPRRGTDTHTHAHTHGHGDGAGQVGTPGRGQQETVSEASTPSRASGPSPGLLDVHRASPSPVRAGARTRASSVGASGAAASASGSARNVLRMSPSKNTSHPSQRPVPRVYPDSATLIPRHLRPMRIVILTIGTRGDVQPFVGLAVAMREAGHDVCICATDDFKRFVTERGVPFVSTNTPRVRQPATWLTVKSVAEMIRALPKDETTAEYWNVSHAFYNAVTQPRLADVIIGTALTSVAAINISESLGVPCYLAKLAPEYISCGFVSVGYSPSRFGWLNMLNTLKYWFAVADAVKVNGMMEVEAEFRQQYLHLPAVTVTDVVQNMLYTPQLLGVSQYLFPRPTDYPNWIFQCGFWTLSEADSFAKRADPALLNFVNPPYVKTQPRAPLAVVTFGSMLNRFREHFMEDIVAELRAHRFRVLVITGWGTPPAGIPVDDKEIMLCTEAPHDWLFPKAFLVVHHGGAGTTGTALASGVPSIIIPILRWADQTQYGEMVDQLGVGVLVRPANPTRADLRHAITRVLHGDLQRAPHTGSIIADRANAIGAFVRAERSSDAALTVLETCLCNLVLPPEQADAIHPLAGPLPPTSSLNMVQRMCVRHCVACHRVRTMMSSGDLFRARPLDPEGVEAASSASTASNSSRRRRSADFSTDISTPASHGSAATVSPLEALTSAAKRRVIFDDDNSASPASTTKAADDVVTLRPRSVAAAAPRSISPSPHPTRRSYRRRD